MNLLAHHDAVLVAEYAVLGSGVGKAMSGERLGGRGLGGTVDVAIVDRLSGEGRVESRTTPDWSGEMWVGARDERVEATEEPTSLMRSRVRRTRQLCELLPERSGEMP